MNITSGVIPTAIKCVVYGPEGIGKSTFASKAPGAVFIDTEGSTCHMDVRRVDTPTTWDDITKAVDWFIQNPTAAQTVVIDTLDWAEQMAIEKVTRENDWKSIETPGYGKGYVYLKAQIQELLGKLTTLVNTGVNVIILCHSITRKFEQPDEMGAYDRYALKLNEKNVSPLVKEWADLLLFANFKTDVVSTQDGKAKGRGGKRRVMYTCHAATWDAKNRFGLAEELPFEFEQVSHLFKTDRPAAQAAPASTKTEAAKPATVTRKEPEEARAVASAQKATQKASTGARKPLLSEERPESMRTEDPQKDRLLGDLWMLMQASQIIDPQSLQDVIGEKGYYDRTVKVRDYETEFISDVLIDAWPQVRDAVLESLNALPF